MAFLYTRHVRRVEVMIFLMMIFFIFLSLSAVRAEKSTVVNIAAAAQHNKHVQIGKRP